MKKKNESNFSKLFGGKDPPTSQLVVIMSRFFFLIRALFQNKVPVYHLHGESGKVS